MIKTVCAEFCKQNHPNNIIHFYLILRPLFCITFLGELLNVLASHFVLLLLFFGRKCFVITLLFFYICHVISNWNNVKIVMLFQFGIMLKTKNYTVILLTTECAYGPPASVYRRSPG